MIRPRKAIRPGLRGKLLAAIVVHMLLLAMVLTGLHVARMRRMLLDDLASRGTVLVTMVANLASAAVTGQDRAALARLAGTAIEQDEVLYAGMTDPGGIILSHANRPDLPNFLGEVRPLGSTPPQAGPAVTRLTVGGRPALHLVAPVWQPPAPPASGGPPRAGGAPQIAGYVFAGISLERLWTTAWKELTLSLGITLLVSGLAILVASVFSRILIEPLLEVVEASRRIASGDFTVRTVPRGDDEMSALCRSFNQMAERLEVSHRDLQEKTRNLMQANEDLETFVFSVSHDLKAPLISIEGYVTYLCEEYADKLDSTARTYVDRIVANTGKMGLLVKDLLEMSRIGRVEESFTEIDTHELLQEVHVQLRVQLDASRGQLVTTSALPMVFYERNRLSQVFANLIGNAIKYASPDRPPLIEVSCTTEDGFHRFAVRDNGIGIAREHHEAIFGMFRRFHSDARTEGTGMGLAIVKKIVETYGGEVWVESVEGRGSTFTFTVPVERPRTGGK